MKHSVKKKAAPMSMVLQALLLCTVLTVLLSALASVLTLKGILGQTMLKQAGGVIAALAAFAGAFLAARMSKEKRLLYALIVCGIYAAALFLVNVLFFRLSSGSVLRVLLPVALMGVLGSLLGSKRSAKGSRRRK